MRKIETLKETEIGSLVSMLSSNLENSVCSIWNCVVKYQKSEGGKRNFVLNDFLLFLFRHFRI